jgi:hypothetical protein
MHIYELVHVDECFEEIDKILREEHWPEVGQHKDLPIDMDWPKYFALQELGKLKCYTIRAPLNESFNTMPLIGYAFYIVDFHLHYKTVKMAQQDILYVRKAHRGIGREFIDWIDKGLKEEGVILSIHHVKPYFDWSHMLEEKGYVFSEKIFSRRLD